MKGKIGPLFATGMLLSAVGAVPTLAQEPEKAPKGRAVMGVVRFVDEGTGFASIYDPAMRIFAVKVKELRLPSGAAVDSRKQLRTGDRVFIPRGARAD